MDAIDRQAAIEALMAWEEDSVWDEECLKHRGEPYWVAPSDVIEQLPSVQPEPQTCCGYDVNKLIVFATACRQQGVENGDLKAFANNCIFAWNVMSGEIAKTIEDIMRGQSDD